MGKTQVLWLETWIKCIFYVGIEVGTYIIIIWFWYELNVYKVKAGGLISNKYEIKMLRYVAHTIYVYKYITYIYIYIFYDR